MIDYKQLISDIMSIFNKKKESAPVPLPYTPSVTADRIKILLTPFTTNLWLSDGVFKYMTKESLAQFLASDPINSRIYKAESHDCDDFSYELMGHVSGWNSDNTFGIVWGQNASGVGHAWNFFVDENEKVWFVEPQTDSIFTPTTEKIWIMIV